ncbi:MAG: outer-membrane lipoprotein carrier protein LolA [Pseudochelatococcus sp.]|jgi:outer membrane lipoprotein-sorting protein|uniref:outer-membrane lipoprotein carrier protein LolA n=1 Tax=Pseudochelatococcus sp. TaxID=2020869 RepID=UPI003D91C91B
MTRRYSRRQSATLRAMIVAVSILPATAGHAQDPLSRFLDGLFKNEQQASPPPAPVYAPEAPPAAPAPPAPPARRSPAGASAPPAPLTPLSVTGPATAVAPAPATTAMPLPPRRPAGLGGAVAGAPIPAPEPVAIAPTPAAAQPAVVAQRPARPAADVPRNAAEAVARVNAYLNGINTLTARFLQTGADGRQAGGTLYVQRPGRLRFAYDPPSTLEIVADGRSVAVRDSKLRTNDVYSIGQTPLKFLLRDNVDLARDVKVRNVDIAPSGAVDITLEDSATLGGTSTVTLRYDARGDVLREWRIVDPQGYDTTVALSGVQVTRR